MPRIDKLCVCGHWVQEHALCGPTQDQCAHADCACKKFSSCRHSNVVVPFDFTIAEIPKLLEGRS